MIAQIFDRAPSFRKVCHYVCQDQTRAQVLYQEGVRGHDYTLMARDFEMIHGLRAERSKPVFHGVLDFHRNEPLDDARMVEIARKYLVEIGMTDTQYAIVKHLDTSHRHLHLVANRIDFSGHPIDNFPEVLRSKDAVEKLVREYDLVPQRSKNLRETNFDALDASETRKYAIYRSIKECLPDCKDIEGLEQRLLRLGIDTRYRTDPQTGQKTGISFRYQNEAFKGSDIDRACSLQQLQHKLELRQQLTQWENKTLALKAAQELLEQPRLQQKEEMNLKQQRQRQQEEARQEKILRQEMRPVHRLRIH
jgi:Relaxase/Mobilisation nuclease domain